MIWNLLDLRSWHWKECYRTGMLLSPWSCLAQRRIKTREYDSRTANPPIKFHVEIKSKDGFGTVQNYSINNDSNMSLIYSHGLSKDLGLFTNRTSPKSDSNYFHCFVSISLLCHWEYYFIPYDIQGCSVMSPGFLCVLVWVPAAESPISFLKNKSTWISKVAPFALTVSPIASLSSVLLTSLWVQLISIMAAPKLSLFDFICIFICICIFN